MCDRKNSRRQRAVTMVEMATVIGLILIMVAIGTAIWMNQSDRAYRNAVAYSTRDLGTAVKMYRAEIGNYPPSGGDFSPFYSYTNVTSIVSQYKAVTLTVTASYSCFSGILKNIQPNYEVALCMEADDSGAAKYRAANQPACCWTKGGVDCSNAANWYKCASKM